jgi:hypothetical protein
LFSLSLRFWRVQYTGGMNKKRPTAIKGTMDHTKKSFSTEIFAGAIISVVQYLAPLRYCTPKNQIFIRLAKRLPQPVGKGLSLG